jgi:hypothetical protein
VTVRRQFVGAPSADPCSMIARLRAAIDAGAPRVVRLFPAGGGHGYPLEEWVLAPLPAICEREGYALALDYGADANVPIGEVARFARSAPEVPMVLLGTHLGVNLGAWRLLDRCPNVLMQLTPAGDADARVDAVRRFGAHRFVFGSRRFEIDSGMPQFGELTPHDRAAVFGGTARLLDHLRWREQYL